MAPHIKRASPLKLSTLASIAAISSNTLFAADVSTKLTANLGGAGPYKVARSEEIILHTGVPNFSGITDADSGTVYFQFKMNWDVFTGAKSYSGFQLLTDGAAPGITIGNSNAENTYNLQVRKDTSKQTAHELVEFTKRNNKPIKIMVGHKTVTFNLIINYNAHGLDEATISMSGGPLGNYVSTQTGLIGDFSFNTIRLKSGSDASRQAVSISDITISTNPIM